MQPSTLPSPDRPLILSALALITAASWGYLFDQIGWKSARDPPPPRSRHAQHPRLPHRRPHHALRHVASVTMVAMMTPTAAPMLLMFAALNRQLPAAAQCPDVPTALFLAGYLRLGPPSAAPPPSSKGPPLRRPPLPR